MSTAPSEYINRNTILTEQLLSPRLTTDIDNYRDLLMEDDKRKINIKPGHNESEALIFERKKNEILLRAKNNLKFENDKLKENMFFIEGENQGLKDENEFLKKALFSHEKKSLDRLKRYQDKTLEMMQKITEMKQELMVLKDSQQSKETPKCLMFKQQNALEQVFSLQKSQEMNINALHGNIFNEISPTNQNTLNEIWHLNREIANIELDLKFQHESFLL